MKTLKLIIITSLFPSMLISQIEYTFDYLIEYDFYLYKDSIPTKIRVYQLTNSKNNDYNIKYSEKDSLNSTLEFIDYKGLNSKSVFLTSDLQNSNTIILDCQYVNRYYNPYKFRTKQYHFSALKDTTLLGTSYAHYQFKSTNLNREKRKKLATNYYIINPNTNFHLPIFDFSTAYEEWKLNKSFPNGIIKEFYQRDYDGDIKMRRILVKYKAIDVKLIIPKECDHLLTPIAINKF